MIDFISKLVKGLLYLLVFVFFVWIGVIMIQEGGFIYLIGAICLSIGLVGIIYPIGLYLYELQDKRWEALRKMYKIPDSLSHEYGEQWGRNFQLVIGDAIKKNTDPEIGKDLQNCSHTVQNISKGPSNDFGDFYYMNAAFRYSGCHLKITDSTGKVISEIV